MKIHSSVYAAGAVFIVLAVFQLSLAAMGIVGYFQVESAFRSPAILLFLVLPALGSGLFSAWAFDLLRQQIKLNRDDRPEMMMLALVIGFNVAAMICELIIYCLSHI